MNYMMKKILYILILVICCACTRNTEFYERVTINTDKFVVTGVEQVRPNGTQPKHYRVMVGAKLSRIGTSVCFYTNTLHHVGDTLCITKMN